MALGNWQGPLCRSSVWGTRCLRAFKSDHPAMRYQSLSTSKASTMIIKGKQELGHTDKSTKIASKKQELRDQQAKQYFFLHAVMVDCLKPVKSSSGKSCIDILRAVGEQGISQYLITLLLRQHHTQLIENYDGIWGKMLFFCNNNQVV